MKKLALTFLLCTFIFTVPINAQVQNLVLNFDGESTYVEFENLNIGSDYTVMFWVNPRNAETGQNFFGQYREDGSNKIVFGFYNDEIHVRLNDVTYESGSMFTGWAHMALQIERIENGVSMVRVFKNGEMLWDQRYETSVGYNRLDRPWVIGMDWDGNNKTDFFDGFIDEFIVVKGVRSQAWIKENMNRTIKFRWPEVGIYLPFQGSGADVSGYDWHATVHNGDGYFAGETLEKPDISALPPTEQALVFNGTDGYVEIPNESDFDFTDGIAIEAWIKVNEFNKLWQAIVTKGEDGWRFQRHQDTGTLAWDTNGLSNVQLSGFTRIDDGEWHHVVAVYDGEKKYIYIDGQLDISVPATGTLDNSDVKVIVGENGTGILNGFNRSFDGSIANVRIWDFELSLSSVLYYAERRETNNSTGHWTFNGTMEDFTSNDNDGIRRGGTSYASVSGGNSTSNEETVKDELPSEYRLEQNYPNPFNPSTNITYAIPVASNVNISVYNLMGKKIAELTDKPHNAGYHTINFNASNLASGVYMYRIVAGTYTETRKLTLIK